MSSPLPIEGTDYFLYCSFQQYSDQIHVSAVCFSSQDPTTTASTTVNCIPCAPFGIWLRANPSRVAPDIEILLGGAPDENEAGSIIAGLLYKAAATHLHTQAPVLLNIAFPCPIHLPESLGLIRSIKTAIINKFTQYLSSLS